MSDHEGLLDRAIDRIDTMQRASSTTAIAVAVVKRYGEDRAGRQAALITFYGFLSVFPLLLLLITFAALAVGDAALKKDIVDSALAQFPVIGPQLAKNIQAVVVGNTLAVVFAAIGLTWGALGITSSLQAASAEVWRRPRSEDPSIWTRTGRGVELLGILAAVAVLSTVVAGTAANGVARFGMGGVAGRLVGLAVVLATNAGGYTVALHLLSPRDTPWRAVLPGAALGAAGWTVVQLLGGWLVGHRLQHASELYGAFAIVLGLIFWINLGAQLFLYSTELNLVLLRHEWPKSLRSEPVS